MKRIVTTTLLSLATVSVQAQTYTLPHSAPLLLNPALTGMHDGSLRVNTVVRTGNAATGHKWNELWNTTSADYRTKSWGHGRQYAGIGMAYTYWQGGNNTIYDNVARVSAAWHLQGGHKKPYLLSAGIQGGHESYSRLIEAVHTGNSYTLGYKQTVSTWQLGVGVTYSTELTQKIRYIAGYHYTNNLFMANEPTMPVSLEEFTKSNHYLLFGSEIRSSNILSVRPSIICRFRMIDVDAMGGTDIRYQPKNTAYFLGLWHPYTGSVAFSAGIARSNWRILSCYQLGNQSIATHNTGLELSLQYIVKGNGRTTLPMVRY